MYAELYRYLILNNKLPVPGIGTFLLQRQSAVSDFPNKRILPPSFSIKLEQNEATSVDGLFKWLGEALKISDQEVRQKYALFTSNLKNQITNGDVIKWHEVGTLSKGLGSEIKFVPNEILILETPVSAERVIRKHAEHNVRVGEDERTSEEMITYFNPTEEKKSHWWAAALVIGLVSVMFLGWYFSENGVTMSASANNKQLNALESSATYKLGQ